MSTTMIRTSPGAPTPPRRRPRRLLWSALAVGLAAAAGTGLLVATTPSVPVGSTVDDTAAAFLTDQLHTSAVPAAAYAIVRDGRVTESGAVGDGVTADTPFLIGSLSKSFTALSVMQLVDQGKITLTDPVTRYLPWFRTADAGAVITVKQLLDQTSGLPTSAGTADLNSPELTLQERVRAVATVHLASRPGEKFQYCNKNYAILGLIVQQASGQDYADYVQTHIFDPLQMRHSFTDIDKARQAGLVDGSAVWFGANLSKQTPAFPGALPDGYLISTANDLTHYVQAQLDGTYRGTRIVSAHGLRLMHHASTPVGPDAPLLDADSYGYAWGIGTVNGHQVISHDGDLATYHANLALLPDEHAGLVTLTARNGVLFDPADAYSGALTILAGAPATAPSRGYLYTYLIIDGLSALLLLAMVIATVRQVRRLRGLAPRLATCGAGRAVLLPGFGNIVAAAAVYAAVFVSLGLSMGSGVPMPIATAFGSAPDITVVVLALIGFLAVRGVAVLVAGAVTAKTRRP